MSHEAAPLQWQLDPSKITTLASGLLLAVFRACARDNIQPIAFPPMEFLGNILMADAGRIEVAVKALRHRRVLKWKEGLSGLKVAPPETAEVVSDNIRLTSAFLFTTACSLCFSVSSTSQIVYEMLTLSGALAQYPVTSRVIFEYLEILSGCHENFAISSAKLPGFEPNPRNLWKQLCDDASVSMRSVDAWITDLYDTNDAKKLALLLHRAFEGVLDHDNKLVELEGSKGGLWIAFVFIWLRPAEVNVFLANARLYPSSTSDPDGQITARLTIHLRSGEQQRQQDGAWSVRIWRDAERAAETIWIKDTPQHGPLRVIAGVPWSSARQYIELINSNQSVVLAIGHLAAALVQVTTEGGTVTSNYNNEHVALLQDICPLWYLNNYTTILSWLGWIDLEPERRERMATTIRDVRHDIKDNQNDMRVFESLITQCIHKYETNFKDFFLIRSSDGDHEKHIIDHAVHLAAQVLEMTVFREMPRHAAYRPLSHVELVKSSALLRSLLLNTKGYQPRMAALDDLQKRAIKAVLPTTRPYSREILAYASDGYVVFRSVLAYDSTSFAGGSESDPVRLDDRRHVGTYQVFPGCLEYRGAARYKALLEEALFAESSPHIEPSGPPVRLFSDDGIFEGVSEDIALELGRRDRSESVVYRLRTEDAEQSIYLATYLSVSRNELIVVPGLESVMETCWWRSIASVMFAQHISRATSSLAQLQALAEVWADDSEPIKWTRLTWELRKAPGRCILTTTSDQDARFFGAGCIPFDTKLLIRHPGVTLLHCVKVAMESQSPNWAVIA